jgi:hypothetical protein
MNNIPLYQIANYNRIYENFRSRNVDRCMFVYVPNNLGDAALANVLGEPDGAAILGIWELILKLCSGQPKPRHGCLTADGKLGRRYCAGELARLFRRPNRYQDDTA